MVKYLSAPLFIRKKIIFSPFQRAALLLLQLMLHLAHLRVALLGPSSSANNLSRSRTQPVSVYTFKRNSTPGSNVLYQ